MTIQKIHSVKGLHDVLPAEGYLLSRIERTARHILQTFGYRRIRLPVLEKTQLFKRSIGDVTDIVEKEMYSFEDIGGEQLSLRPEGTAGCIRACLQHGLISKGQAQRLWYQGAFFRRERPQKGRYRQFYQIGAEALGYPGPDIDAELLIVIHLLWERLALDKIFILKINTLGSTESRKRYRLALQDYLVKHQDQIDDNARQRISVNPLRVLDSKDPSTRRVIENAPRMAEYLGSECKAYHTRFKAMLDHAGIAFEEDEYLVRGLDYYTRTVFEWVHPDAGAQNTVCAGGRYDGLVEHLGGHSVPAAGFAIGVDRVALAMNMADDTVDLADIYIAMIGEHAENFASAFAVDLRRQLPDLTMVANCGGGSIKTQMRRADKAGARIVLIFGDEEMKNQTVTLKYLRQEGEQEQIPVNQLIERIRKLVC